MIPFDKSKRKNDDKPKRRPTSRIVIIGLVLALVALIGVVGFLLVYQPEYRPMSDVPAARLVYARGAERIAVDFQMGERLQTTFPSEIIDSKEKSPDGRWEIRFEWLDKYTTSSLVLEDLTGEEGKRTFGTFYGADNTLSWSPDQQWVAFTAYDPAIDTSSGGHAAEIWKVNISTGDVKRLSINTYLDSDPFFSPDGRQLVYISAADGFPRVYLMDLATEKTHLLTPDLYGDNPKWSPDGQWIAFDAFYRVDTSATQYTNYVNIYVVRIDGTHVQPITFGITGSSRLLGWQTK